MNTKSAIRLGSNKSPVIISENHVKDFRRWWQLRIGTHKTTPVILLIDEIVYALHHDKIEDILKNMPVSVSEIRQIAGGENCKQFENAGRILTDWISAGITKDTVIICIGGGSLTDLGGFMAAIYKRGLRTVYIPTSLLSMTDASLGGKNAINCGEAKNQLGTIRFPEFTFITTAWFTSLPPSEMKSGYAEIMKHALLDGRSFIKTMLGIRNAEIAPSAQLLIRSIRVKMKIVTDDPYEKHGRHWLNLGHSFGHAYESYFNSLGKSISHGHAVALGLAEALCFSVKLSGFPPAVAADITKWLKEQFDFNNLPGWNDISAYILKDKKNLSSGIRLVLMKSPGKPVIQDMDEAVCKDIHAGFLSQL
ncbi:MAG: hypothetical protein A2W93_12710 [Bacteroidetes bacterium GWF2_43_63]|nr:MAG: hypothetical protein A2W94_06355 [Bacteroidetes bacterium GWE2_42_42]OFY54644.1 MAG: hypothetical protein A2W93_12710 [Bacteroidetes bacterium GWF2_43_63]HBG71849.1 hypothetical protein [Bacteroidales bacterium]HCB61432.1 hypothetical protein [Bacteroidales bacterium]HCY23333.1 hypothetical protein [Bacteroidales bacterium]